MSLSALIDLLTKSGPSGKHADTIKQTWWGTAIGQATVAVGLLLAYASIVLASIKLLYGPQFQLLYKEQPLILFLALIVPVLIIGIFFSLPAYQRARRERKIRPLAESSTPPKPGYFRLQPYEVEDAADFKRPDRAIEECLGWLERTKHSVLYLSGASGVGKSSLVNAALIPKMTQNDWSIHTLRGRGQPLAELTAFLAENPDLSGSNIIDSRDPILTLETIDKYRTEYGAKPTLIVLDQFEEYLILDGSEEASEYAGFLKDFAQKPFTHIKLLHVFREDYRTLLFKQSLPDYIVRQSGFDLAPFNRREAEEFLRGGPRRLVSGYDELFQGLDKIENKGLYRPITLNMVGFVLEREGSMLSREPAKLMEHYLKDCITCDNAQDMIKPVLNAMITSSGTKQVRMVEDIAKVTGLPEWQIKGTLVSLREDGLVRPLSGGQWEVSHDFLARLMSSFIGTVKRPFSQRTRTTALTLGLGWIVAMAMAIPLWSGELKQKVQANEIEMLRQIRSLGFRKSEGSTNGWNVRLENRNFTNSQFDTFIRLIQNYRVTELDLSGVKGITDLSPLTNMPLKRLDLSFVEGINDLTPLKNMPLQSLYLTNVESITDLTPLKNMPLTSLDLSGANGITDLTPLKNMPLRQLDLSEMDGIIDLTPLQDLKLASLNLSNTHGITNLTPLKNMPLNSLNLSEARGIIDLSPLKQMNLRGAEIITFRLPPEVLQTLKD